MDECREAGWEFFAPTGLVTSLLFVRCQEEDIVRYSNYHFGQLWLYRNGEYPTLDSEEIIQKAREAREAITK